MQMLFVQVTCLIDRTWGGFVDVKQPVAQYHLYDTPIRFVNSSLITCIVQRLFLPTAVFLATGGLLSSMCRTRVESVDHVFAPFSLQYHVRSCFSNTFSLSSKLPRIAIGTFWQQCMS